MPWLCVRNLRKYLSYRDLPLPVTYRCCDISWWRMLHANGVEKWWRTDVIRNASQKMKAPFINGILPAWNSNDDQWLAASPYFRQLFSVKRWRNDCIGQKWWRWWSSGRRNDHLGFEEAPGKNKYWLMPISAVTESGMKHKSHEIGVAKWETYSSEMADDRWSQLFEERGNGSLQLRR